jgi:hypothetical protein
MRQNMRPVALVLGLLGPLTISGVCHAQIFNDPFAEYAERTITISPGAGNAKDANAALHAIDPWPAYAGYTRVPGRGEHAVSSIVRLNRFPNPFLAQQPGFGVGPSGGSIGTGAAGAGSDTGIGSVTGGGAVTPVQPISGF